MATQIEGQPTQNEEQLRPLADYTNGEILDAIRNEIGGGFARRIPASTQGDIKESLQNIMRIPGFRNDFEQTLVRRFCGEYIHSKQWVNPLAEFKRASQNYGDIYEEVAMGLAKARAYDENNEYLAQDIFGTYKLDTKTAFHMANRDNWYGITLRERSLQTAFTNDNGLGQYMTELMNSIQVSDANDEFLCMCQLFTEYARLGTQGYYKIHTPDVASPTANEEDAKQMLRLLQTVILNVCAQPTDEYNTARMVVTTKPEDLIIFMPPEVHSALNVRGYASLFNEDRAQTGRRTIDIRSKNFGIDGLQAILTTKQFLFCYDTIFETNVSQVHPISLGTNMFLRHKEAISVSPFAPAVLFWTHEGTREEINLPDGVLAEKPTFQIRVSGYGDPAYTPSNVKRGMMVQVVSDLKVEGSPNFTPKGIRYFIGKTDKPLSEFTHITNTGVLVCGPDEPNAHIPVRAQATYVDPVRPEVEQKASDALDVPVVGDGVLGLGRGFVTKLTIDPIAPTVPNGSSVQFKALASMTDGRDIDVTNIVDWTLGNQAGGATGTIDLSGKYTATSGQGTLTVQAVIYNVVGVTQVTNAAASTRSDDPEEGREEPPEE